MSDELFNIGALSDELSLSKNFFSARSIVDLCLQIGFYIQKADIVSEPVAWF